jgi:hypothetical protein
MSCLTSMVCQTLALGAVHSSAAVGVAWTVFKEGHALRRSRARGPLRASGFERCHAESTLLPISQHTLGVIHDAVRTIDLEQR